MLRVGGDFRAVSVLFSSGSLALTQLTLGPGRVPLGLWTPEPFNIHRALMQAVSSARNTMPLFPCLLRLQLSSCVEPPLMPHSKAKPVTSSRMLPLHLVNSHAFTILIIQLGARTLQGSQQSMPTGRH